MKYGLFSKIIGLLRSLVDQTCFEFIDISYFGVVNFLGLMYAN